MKDDWRSHRTITNTRVENTNDRKDKSKDEDEDEDEDSEDDFDETDITVLNKIIDTQHPQVFNYMKNLGKFAPSLAIRIAEACLIGIQEGAKQRDNWHFF